MAGAVASFVFKRVFKESAKNHFGTQQDPYFEEANWAGDDVIVEVDSAGQPVSKTSKPAKQKSGGIFKRKSKQKKHLPPGLTEKDRKILTKVKRRAYSLDRGFSLCGFRFGWDGIIGIVPVLGDVSGLYMALHVLHTCQEAGLPSTIEAQMYSNIIADFVMGLIPFLGDVADVIFKCNTRNAILLEQVLTKRGQENLRALERNGGTIPQDARLGIAALPEYSAIDMNPTQQQNPGSGQYPPAIAAPPPTQPATTSTKKGFFK